MFTIQSKWKATTLILLLLTIVVIFPFLFNLSFLKLSLLTSNENEFSTTLLKTVVYAIISALILTIFGFIGALFLRNIFSLSQIGKTLSILILPVMIGNISIAFMFKLIWGDSLFFSKIISLGSNYKLALLIILQLWQFGLLFIYLFWMQFQTISNNFKNYAKANKFSLYQQVKDIYLPSSKNLSILISGIVFSLSFYEQSKIQYLFKSSQGTNTELISNWLERNYQTTLIANPNYSQTFTFNSGAIVALCSILSLIIMLVIINIYIKAYSKTKLYIFSYKKENKKNIFENVWAILLLLFVIIPLILCVTKIQFLFNTSILELGFPLLMTLIASLFSAIIAILFGISSRLGWQNLLSSFTNQSILFFIGLFILLLVPPLIILISGYKWMGLIGYSSQTVIYIIWTAGHIILTLPLLGSFVLFNHFRVTVNELNYLRVYKLKTIDIVKNSFLKRFKAEYILLLIITFSFIWNEGVLNNLFSDYIPSYVSGLNMLITGRGADYSKAFGYLLLSFGIALTATLTWRLIIENAHRVIKNHEKH